MAKDKRVGFTTIYLKDWMAKVDKLSMDLGIENRSETIRMILKKYFDLKDNGIDLLLLNHEKLMKALEKWA